MVIHQNTYSSSLAADESKFLLVNFLLLLRGEMIGNRTLRFSGVSSSLDDESVGSIGILLTVELERPLRVRAFAFFGAGSFLFGVVFGGWTAVGSFRGRPRRFFSVSIDWDLQVAVSTKLWMLETIAFNSMLYLLRRFAVFVLEKPSSSLDASLVVGGCLRGRLRGGFFLRTSCLSSVSVNKWWNVEYGRECNKMRDWSIEKKNNLLLSVIDGEAIVHGVGM